MENKETFNYTYSAKEQAEIKNIRKKYMAPEEDKMAQLRRLDAATSKKASTNALSVGVVGALIMGMGMSLVMTDLGDVFSLSNFAATVWGICIGIVGIVMASVALPVYNQSIKREREKIAPEIMRITDELLNM